MGLIGLIVVKVLAPGFYSRQEVKTPVKIAIVTLILTQLMKPGVYRSVETCRAVTFYWSGGVSECFAAYWQLRKQKIFTPQPGWMAFLLRLVVAVLVMGRAFRYVTYHAGVVIGYHALALIAF